VSQVFQAPSQERHVDPRFRASYWLTQPTLRVWVLAVGLLLFYFALSPSSANFGSLNLLTENALPLAWVAAGQMAVVIAAQSVLIVLIGAGLGVINGFFVAYRGMSAFIVTIATWSIIDGLALLVLPSAGGAVPNGFATVINAVSPVSFGAIALIGSLLLWAWARTTAGFMRLRAVGSSPEKAHWAGVAERRTTLMAFAFSGSAAACAGLVLAGITQSGDPNIGTSYILNGLAVAVIGGVSLFGGSGSFAGVVGGAMVLTVINDVVFALGLTPYLEPAIVGGILAIAVLTTGLGSQGRVTQGAGT
jgi:ribose transport system permease protein